MPPDINQIAMPRSNVKAEIKIGQKPQRKASVKPQTASMGGGILTRKVYLSVKKVKAQKRKKR